MTPQLKTKITLQLQALLVIVAAAGAAQRVAQHSPAAPAPPHLTSKQPAPIDIGYVHVVPPAGASAPIMASGAYASLPPAAPIDPTPERFTFIKTL